MPTPDERRPTGGSVSRRASVLQSFSERLGKRVHALLLGDDDEDDDDIAATRMETAGGAADDARDAARPSQAGKYDLGGELGRGGVGVVLRGRDVDLGRDVAIKFLHQRYSENATVLQRFVEEAQIGGQLQHPGIVPVYDLGDSEGQPFFVMKMVRGQTLQSLFDERPSLTHDRRRLLGVFEQVCQAMAYAHARGVIHRDLKPMNVMVGAFGEVQVVDWGLGKVLGDRREQAEDVEAEPVSTVRSRQDEGTAQSLVGSVMGTPAYMAPEQARGEIDALDARADVFALGAMLCELLTGAPPYQEDDLMRAIHAAAKAELGECHQRLSTCVADRELVELTRQCLAPDPGDRPRDGGEVAARLGAHLANVEERARAAELEAAEQRARAAAERRTRRLTVGLAASVIAFVAAIAGGWLWLDGQQRDRLRRLEQGVEAALAEASVLGERAEWPAAEAAVARAEDLLAAAAEAPPPALRERVAEAAGPVRASAASARADAERAASNERLLARLTDVRQPEGEFIYATDWSSVADAYDAAFADEGLDVRDGAVADVVARLAARGLPAELAAALDEWALARARAADADGADRLRRIAAALDDDDAFRVRIRAAVASGDRDALRATAREARTTDMPPATWSLLGRAVGAFDGALAREVLERGVTRHPTDFVLCMQLARHHYRGRPSRPEDAGRWFTAALALRPDAIEPRHELAVVLETTPGRAVQAEELMRASILRRPDDGHLHFHLGNALFEQRRFAEALQSFQTATRLDPTHGPTWLNVGLSQLRLDDDGAAEEPLRRALAINPKDELALCNLGLLLARRGETDEAAALAASLRELLGDGGTASDWANLGTVYAQLGRHDDAIAAFRRGAAREPEAPEPLIGMAESMAEAGRKQDAERTLEQALTLAPDQFHALELLAWLAMDRSDYATAETRYRRMTELAPKSAPAHEGLGLAQQRAGKRQDALATLRKARALGPMKARSYDLLATILLEAGEFEEGEAVLRAGIAQDAVIPPMNWKLGQLLAKRQDYAGAVEQFALCVRAFPDEAGAHANYADALAGDGQLEQAAAAYRRAVELAPGMARGWVLLGRTLARQGKDREALPALRRGHELGATSPDWPYPTAAWIEEVERRLGGRDR